MANRPASPSSCPWTNHLHQSQLTTKVGASQAPTTKNPEAPNATVGNRQKHCPPVCLHSLVSLLFWKDGASWDKVNLPTTIQTDTRSYSGGVRHVWPSCMGSSREGSPFNQEGGGQYKNKRTIISGALPRIIIELDCAVDRLVKVLWAGPETSVREPDCWDPGRTRCATLGRSSLIPLPACQTPLVVSNWVITLAEGKQPIWGTTRMVGFIKISFGVFNKLLRRQRAKVLARTGYLSPTQLVPVQQPNEVVDFGLIWGKQLRTLWKDQPKLEQKNNDWVIQSKALDHTRMNQTGIGEWARPPAVGTDGTTSAAGASTGASWLRRTVSASTVCLNARAPRTIVGVAPVSHPGLPTLDACPLGPFGRIILLVFSLFRTQMQRRNAEQIQRHLN